ncbi:MAG: hypothetical protein ACRESF_16345 [Pseudomonas sp.]
MVTLVPGGAIEAFVKTNGLTPLTSETERPDGTSADCVTDKGIVVWCKEDGQVRLAPFRVAAPARQRTMYDSVTWQAIPADAEVVAGYIDGLYRWPDEAWARFPKARQVRIAVFASTNAGDVLDVETGDATPAQSRDWVVKRLAAGIIPTIYCDLSNIDAVRAACSGLTFDWWAAHYTGVPHLEPGSVATQWADPAAGSGSDYDISLCAPGWPR